MQKETAPEGAVDKLGLDSTQPDTEEHEAIEADDAHNTHYVSLPITRLRGSMARRAARSSAALFTAVEQRSEQHLGRGSATRPLRGK